MLGLGELSSGQRDIILTPQMSYLNASKISEMGGVTTLPRMVQSMVINGSIWSDGWLMDFRGERENHLGTIGGDEPEGHNYFYGHYSLEVEEGQEV